MMFCLSLCNNEVEISYVSSIKMLVNQGYFAELAALDGLDAFEIFNVLLMNIFVLYNEFNSN